MHVVDGWSASRGDRGWRSRSRVRPIAGDGPSGLERRAAGTGVVGLEWWGVGHPGVLGPGGTELPCSPLGAPGAGVLGRGGGEFRAAAAVGRTGGPGVVVGEAGWPEGWAENGNGQPGRSAGPSGSLVGEVGWAEVEVGWSEVKTGCAEARAGASAAEGGSSEVDAG
jgi:hypothetical protein